VQLQFQNSSKGHHNDDDIREQIGCGVGYDDGNDIDALVSSLSDFVPVGRYWTTLKGGYEEKRYQSKEKEEDDNIHDVSRHFIPVEDSPVRDTKAEF
jgi:hypothetical protein